MNKITGIILSVLLFLGLFAIAYLTKEPSIDELLIPYQRAADRVNEELGSNIYIPEENKEKVYNNVKNMTPDEVEKMLREEYLLLDPSYGTPSD